MKKHRWSAYRLWARLAELGVVEYDLSRVCTDCRRHAHMSVSELPLTDDGRIDFPRVFGTLEEWSGECGPRA